MTLAVLEAENITRKTGYTASPRIIWNGGFWDGYYDAENHRPVRRLGAVSQPLPAWSPFYCAGYEDGYAARSFYGWTGTDSTHAWEEFTASQTTQALRKMLKGEEGFKA